MVTDANTTFPKLIGLLVMTAAFLTMAGTASATSWIQMGNNGSLKHCSTQNSPDCAYDNDAMKVVVDIVPSGKNQGKLRFKHNSGDDLLANRNTAGCWQGGDKKTVLCNPGVASSIEIWGSSQSDTLRDKTDIPTTIYGGQGNDLEFGGPGPDTFGGPGCIRLDPNKPSNNPECFKQDTGSDQIFAGKGADTIYQQDGQRDAAIGCGNASDGSTLGDGSVDKLLLDDADLANMRAGCRSDLRETRTWMGPVYTGFTTTVLVNRADIY